MIHIERLHYHDANKLKQHVLSLLTVLELRAWHSILDKNPIAL